MCYLLGQLVSHPLSQAFALSLVLALGAVLVDIKLGPEIGLSENLFFSSFFSVFNFVEYQFSDRAHYLTVKSSTVKEAKRRARTPLLWQPLFSGSA